ncbi:MAG: glycosyltransferase family 4 protein [Planctomycetota bacterium]
MLLVAHGFPPHSFGGVEQHVAGLARALLADGHRVHVYTRTGEGEAGTLAHDVVDGLALTRVAYRFEDVRTLPDLYRSAMLDAAFARFLSEAGPFDVAHVHHLTGLSLGIVDQLRQRGVRSVLTLHDYWTICPRGQMWHRRGEVCAQVEPARCSECLAVPFGHLLGAEPAATLARLHDDARATLRAVDALVVPSARALPPFAALGLDTATVRVVENAVDVEHLAAVPPLARRPRGQPLRVGFLGTLIPSKGLDVLVDALQRLPAGAATLDVWGNAVPYHGDEGFLTRVFSRLRPEDRVVYHGPYHTHDLARILTPLDCVVAPALWAEAFGLTVREALAAGRPALVSQIGGLADAVRHEVDGFVLPPGDRAALARALARLATEPDLAARFGAAGRGRPRPFDTMARDLVAIYRHETSVSEQA